MIEVLDEALAVLSRGGAGRPALALILGSGFGRAIASWPVSWRISYDQIPGMPACRVAGHAGELMGVKLAQDLEAWVFSGRFHAYEGLKPAEVVWPVDLAAHAGAGKILLTCAAGGIHQDLQPGDLVLVTDHLNLLGWLPPLGQNTFLDLTRVYDPEALELIGARADAAGQSLHRGVLAAMPGPAYETPAEIRMLATLGADMVSMSTVPEAIRARALGLDVGALACVSNLAAGRGPTTLDHDEVLAQVSRSVAASGEWLLDSMTAWASTPGS
jgi:purine-nucleoside phosphorylase